MSALRRPDLPLNDAAAPAHAPQAQGAQPAGSLLRFITCGSVDDGKSTLIGRLLYDTGSVFDDQLEALERDSRKFGTTGEAMDFALLVDGLTAEREQGITIDVAYRYFSTARRAFIIADTPGHEQYTRNMATGASQADLAVILVDARKGILPQTRRHSFITSMVGIRSVIVAVNKMDLVAYDEATFRAIEAAYREMLPALGFVDVRFIPLSARDGDNVTRRSANMAWYDGPTLIEGLEAAEPEALQDEGGLRLPIQYVNRPNLDFRGFCGQISAGTVTKGMEITILPGGETAAVKEIYGVDGPVPEASAGQAVTITLSREVDVSRGDVFVRKGDALAGQRWVRAQILSLSGRPLLAGTRLVARLSSGQSPAAIATLDAAVDIHSFQPRPATALSMNEIGRVSLSFEKPLVAALYKDSRDLGSLILIDPISNETVALGVVTELEPAQGPLAQSVTAKRDMRLLAYRGVAAILIGLLGLILGLPLYAAIILGAADALMRPVLRRILVPHAPRVGTSDPTEVGDGSGI